MPGRLGSVIFYVKAKQLKVELNRKFRDKYPDFSPDLRLSMLRSIKLNMVGICMRQVSNYDSIGYIMKDI